MGCLRPGDAPLCRFVGNFVAFDRKQKIKRVDEACRLRVGLSVGLSGCSYTLSPHFVSPLCRLRFVSTLCPYALSKESIESMDSNDSILSDCSILSIRTTTPTSRRRRHYPLSPVSCLQHTVGTPRLSGGTAYCHCLLLLPVSCLPPPVSRLLPVPNHPTCLPGISSRYSHRKVGRAVPVTPLRGVTGEPRTGFVPPPPPIPPPIRHCGNCPGVARTFLSAHVHEGRQECLPHNTTLHCCG